MTLKKQKKRQKKQEDSLTTEQKNDKSGKETAAQAAMNKAIKKREKRKRASDAKAIAAAAAVADAAVAEIERDEAEAMAEAFQFPSYSKEIGEWNEARPKLLRRIRMIEQLDFQIADEDKEIEGDERKIEAKRNAQIAFVQKLTKQLLDEEEKGEVVFKNSRFLSSGCERHWPDARGFFHNKDHSVFVRVNEQDHMRVVSVCDKDEKNKKNQQDIQLAFKRLVGVLDGVSDYLGSTVDFRNDPKQSRQYMRNDHLGYVVTCPSGLGTGLSASALVKIPNLSKKEDFDSRLKGLGLQKRIHIMGLQDCKSNKGNADCNEGHWNISNAECYGPTEVELVNRVIKGVRKCIEWEKKLEQGQELEEVD